MKTIVSSKLVAIALTLTLLTSGAVVYVTMFDNQNNIQALEISKNQMDAQNPSLINSSDDEYFELVGFGQLELNDTNQNVNLINPSENKVYLSFDVIYNDETLYSSSLIEPGKMEQYNVYSSLDAGEHTITYSINVYDMENKKPLWTGIKQEQEIIIKS